MLLGRLQVLLLVLDSKRLDLRRFQSRGRVEELRKGIIGKGRGSQLLQIFVLYRYLLRKLHQSGSIQSLMGGLAGKQPPGAAFFLPSHLPLSLSFLPNKHLLISCHAELTRAPPNSSSAILIKQHGLQVLLQIRKVEDCLCDDTKSSLQQPCSSIQIPTRYLI